VRFDLSDEQQLLRSAAREFLTKELPMAEARRLADSGDPHDRRLWRAMAEQGWTGLAIAEAHGGCGLGLVDLAVLMEEMGRALLGGPFFASPVFAGTMLEAAGAYEEAARVASGERVATVALVEEGGVWEPEKLGMTSGLAGRKLFVQEAAAADLLVVAARDAVVVVERGAAGVEMGEMPGMDTTRRLSWVKLAGPAGKVAARGAAAVAAIDRAIEVATAALCAEMTGGMQRVQDLAVQYAKTRKQFGQPIGKFQAVQHACADMWVMTECSRAAALYAAYALDRGTADARFAVSVAKAYASDAYRECGNRGIQVHGGMGFTWDNDTHYYYKRAKASEAALGDANYHRERIARLTLDERGEGNEPRA